ncbi:hypothetical protein DENSPDRAFT_189770 [Dentipellis sp. KUC8613]|nr:hypothetical protein DENSPDRAFT_189770 [Dentipellis sp. KUC8613]
MMTTCRGNDGADGYETWAMSRGVEGEATRQRRSGTAERMWRYGTMLVGRGAKSRTPLSKNGWRDRHENRRTYDEDRAQHPCQKSAQSDHSNLHNGSSKSRGLIRAARKMGALSTNGWSKNVERGTRGKRRTRGFRRCQPCSDRSTRGEDMSRSCRCVVAQGP